MGRRVATWKMLEGGTRVLDTAQVARHTGVHVFTVCLMAFVALDNLILLSLSFLFCNIKRIP